jgi:hypothetical protein
MFEGLECSYFAQGHKTKAKRVCVECRGLLQLRSEGWIIG